MSPLMPLWVVGSDLPVKALAVVGAFALGGFLLGRATELVARFAFNQALPGWVSWGVRLLGGVACAWLAALWLFGSGGGFGGPGGFGLGGTGVSDKSTTPDKAGKQPADKTQPRDRDPDPLDKGKSQSPGDGAGAAMHVEVLGDGPLRKIARAGKPDLARRYRLADDPGRLHTLEEVQALISRGRKGRPALRSLEVIIYRDSPDRNNPLVADLLRWARDLDAADGRLLVEVAEPDREAPPK